MVWSDQNLNKKGDTANLDKEQNTEVQMRPCYRWQGDVVSVSGGDLVPMDKRKYLIRVSTLAICEPNAQEQVYIV